MVSPPLSLRLQALVDEVRPAEPVWDIGCDHARVGYLAVVERRASEAFLVDKSREVVSSIHRLVERHVEESVRDRLSVLHADGALLPAQPVTGTVVIAGMGAGGILRILNQFVVPNACPPLRLVLQPAVQATRIADWISVSSFTLFEERTLRERGRIHPLFVAEQV